LKFESKGYPMTGRRRHTRGVKRQMVCRWLRPGPGSFTLWKDPHYPLYRKLLKPQGWCGWA